MVHLSTSVALLAPVYSLMHVALVTGSPFGNPGLYPEAHPDLEKREDEDESDADIAADRTGPLRDGMFPLQMPSLRQHRLAQQTISLLPPALS